MGENYELLLISEDSGKQCNVNAYKTANGECLATFKGGTSFHNTLCIYRDEYIVSAVPRKAVITLYEISSRSQQAAKMVLPGVVRALKISHDNTMVAAGIGEKVLVWELAGGELLSSLSRHYQNVTCLAFSHDDGYLVSSGEDGIVTVWDLSDVWDEEVSGQENGVLDPYHSWTCHTLPVSDVLVGCRFRVFSSSLDRSVKVHDIATKETIMTIVLHSGITSMVTAPGEISLYAGCVDGTIVQVDLMQCQHHSKGLDSNNVAEVQGKQVIAAHENSVACLECSFDGSYIVSGSLDHLVKLWDVESHQCLRTIKCEGAVTNTKLILATQRFNSSFKPQWTFPKLSRQTVLRNESDESTKKYFRIQKGDVELDEDRKVEEAIESLCMP